MRNRIHHVSFVCTGNICRSPFAEGLCRKRLLEKGLANVKVDSAGLLALPGNSATQMAQRVALEHGVDLAHHQAKPVNEPFIVWSDRILVMEKTHERDLLNDFPVAQGKVLLLRFFARSGSRNRGVADPYGLNYEAYRFCFLDIEEAISGLVDFLASTTRTFTPVAVSCYEGYKSNESPRLFVLEGNEYKISKIVDRWYDGGVQSRENMAEYYKVQTIGGDHYVLRYDRQSDTWAVLVD